MEKLTDVAGIGPASAKLLADHQVKTVAALAAIKLAELQKIPGFGGELRARAVKQAAADYLKGKKTASKTAKSGQTQITAVTATATTARKAVSPANLWRRLNRSTLRLKKRKRRIRKKTTRKTQKQKVRKKKRRTKKNLKRKVKIRKNPDALPEVLNFSSDC